MAVRKLSQLPDLTSNGRSSLYDTDLLEVSVIDGSSYKSTQVTIGQLKTDINGDADGRPQTVSGLKTFTTVPKTSVASSAVITDAAHLANKAYVDNNRSSVQFFTGSGSAITGNFITGLTNNVQLSGKNIITFTGSADRISWGTITFSLYIDSILTVTVSVPYGAGSDNSNKALVYLQHVIESDSIANIQIKMTRGSLNLTYSPSSLIIQTGLN